MRGFKATHIVEDNIRIIKILLEEIHQVERIVGFTERNGHPKGLLLATDRREDVIVPKIVSQIIASDDISPTNSGASEASLSCTVC